jgi:SAM-dependent methyltransferase
MACDCCGAAAISTLTPYGSYEHLKCHRCGYERFVCGDTQVSARDYERDADYVDDLNIALTSSDLILWHHREALRLITARFPSGDTVTLDIGCFNGFFVKELLRLGYNAEGIDFNKVAIAQGREKFALGPRISDSTVEDLVAGGRQFDAITLFEVLEHLPDPQAFLRHVARLLKPGGLIILSTPNNKMCWRPPLDFPPHHLSRFTVEALQGCLLQTGIEPIFAHEQMSTYELLRHYVGAFFRANDRGSLRGGEFKHKQLTTVLRRGMNRLRWLLSLLLMPIDKLLYWFGLRYISQVVVGQKPRLTV